MGKALRGQVANWRGTTTMRASPQPSEVMALPTWFKKPKPKQPVPYDFRNQLDLFSEADTDTPAPVESTPARTSEGNHARPRPPQQLGFESLVPLQPLDAGGTAPAEPTGRKSRGDSPAVRGSDVRAGFGEEAGIPPGRVVYPRQRSLLDLLGIIFAVSQTVKENQLLHDLVDSGGRARCVIRVSAVSGGQRMRAGGKCECGESGYSTAQRSGSHFCRSMVKGHCACSRRWSHCSGQSYGLVLI